MQYFKMQGTGNDFIFFDCIDGSKPELNSTDISKLCDRSYGIGADGVIFICSSQKADCKMDIYNADGSRATMCGNGIRCVAHYYKTKFNCKRNDINIETLSGLKQVNVSYIDGKYAYSYVNMGKASTPENCWVYLDCLNSMIDLYKINVGNPHAVCFIHPEWSEKLLQIYNELQRKPNFPNGVNVEFVESRVANSAKVRVFERGVGETMSCGTGATAVAQVFNFLDNCEDGYYNLCFKGGSLSIHIDKDKNATLCGQSELLEKGDFEKEN